jgi:hypothetical protein
MSDASHNKPSTPFADEAGLTPHQVRLAERMRAEGYSVPGDGTRSADIVRAQTAPVDISFIAVARLSQDLKISMHAAHRWPALRPDQRESLDMIQYCVARILSGEADQADTWDVIAVHARGVAQRLEKK